MNSYKTKSDSVREYREKYSEHPIDVALRQARAQAEKELFKEKIHGHLIIGGAMAMIFVLLFWW